MHLKQLEIVGFKSFVDRTVVPLHHDMIGIVGPNGCGKSNVVDAIRWCMGEQSAKHLRGKAMADVIFNGSELRGPHGMAEVTLTFDNRDQETALTLPIEYRDYAEIAVTRRLYRDGTSEYLINKTQVRLKDLTDLFLGTGVGAKAYSIVEQGKIGLLLSARAEDRRGLIEEAAGITKYKHRRKQAEQKMELTRQNLTRVGDLVREIERNLASLERQAAKAERYRAYRKELEFLTLHEASHRFLELTVCHRVEEAALHTAVEQAQAARTQLEVRHATLEADRASLFSLEQAMETAQNESFAAANEVRSLEARIERARDKLTSLQTREKEVKSEFSHTHGQGDDLGHELTSLQGRLVALEDEYEEVKHTAQRHEQELQQRESQANQGDVALRTLRAQAQTAAANVAGHEAKFEGFSRQIRDLQNRRERLSLDEDELRSEQTTLQKRRDEASENVAELAAIHRDAEQRVERLQHDLQTSKDARDAAARQLETDGGQLAQQRSRLQALEEIHRRREGLGAGTQNLLGLGHAAIQGLVAERIHTPKPYLVALAGVLGERLQDVIVADLAQGAELLAELAQKSWGRAAVVALPSAFAAPTVALLSDDGVVGRLLDLVRFADGDARLVTSLVGEATVVRDVEAALRLHLAYPEHSFVTLDGTVLRPNGRLVGGAGDASARLLEQQQEMDELRDLVSTGATQVETLQAIYNDQQACWEATTLELDRAKSDVHRSHLELVSRDKDRTQLEEQSAALEARVGSFSTELEELDDQLAQAVDERSDTETAFERLKVEVDDATQGIEAAEQQAAQQRAYVSEQLTVVTEAKVTLARLREQRDALQMTTQRLHRSHDELTSRREKLHRDRIDLAHALGATGATLWLAEEQRQDALALARRAEEHLGILRGTFEQARAAVAEQESGTKELQAQVALGWEKKTKHEMESQRLQLATEHLLEAIREKFRGLDLRRVLGDYHRLARVEESHRLRMNELQDQLSRMGPVNLDAVREYDETKKRFDFYDTQQADLHGALADLEKAIAEMDHESRRRFQTTFDSINEKFQVMFPKMFRGGSARLQLTTTDDLLEAGIDILAQPPGKKLGNLDLMSGGEKALTAVSLLLAMFQHKPSPFCILDEVDAPLDEANVARYNDALRTMTEKSQFLLITHIKKTMQSVDVLLGVTMQEPGVSKLVAVTVNDAPSQRAAKTLAPPPPPATDESDAAAVALPFSCYLQVGTCIQWRVVRLKNRRGFLLGSNEARRGELRRGAVMLGKRGQASWFLLDKR